MKMIKLSMLVAVIAILTAVLAACEGLPTGITASNNSSNGYSTATPSSNDYGNNSGNSYGNNSNGNGYGNNTSGTSLIQTATAEVKGKSETILTDVQGHTLYYFTPDTADASKCTGACEKKWPALLAVGSATPSSATSLPGTLSVAASGNGQQVSYNGHFLYTFAKDHAAGETNGEGIGGTWYVATPDLK